MVVPFRGWDEEPSPVSSTLFSENALQPTEASKFLAATASAIVAFALTVINAGS